MKKLIYFSLFSLLTVGSLHANKPIKNAEKPYEIKLEEMNQLFVVTTSYSEGKNMLQYSARIGDILYKLLDEQDFETDQNLDPYYKLEVSSEVPIKDVKEQILDDLLTEIGWHLQIKREEIPALQISWIEGVDEYDKIAKGKNSGAKVHILFGNRSWIGGHDLNSFCEELKKEFDINFLVPGDMDIHALPEMWVNKRKLMRAPKEYLEKLGFLVEETNKTIETPFITSI